VSNLLIVESPAKAKKIAGFLGPTWRVEACRGHIRDLPKAELGVDVARDFQPTYAILKGQHRRTKRLAKAMHVADAIYLATDPDREGEAIAWHLLELADLPSDKPIFRAAFTSITPDAVQAALQNPRKLDDNLVEAQQARRIVDRLVGYLVSPLACKALDGRHSAGRVQSVCLRLVVEREREIIAFEPQPYWTLALKLAADETPFEAKLFRIKEAPPHLTQPEHVGKLNVLLQGTVFWVAKAGQSIKPRSPQPPFTTSSLQQAAAQMLDLAPDRTMQIAQQLYEAGLITYHRTDSVNVAPEAQAAARAYINREYGADYVPVVPPTYEAKTKNAQEAHECIRPTDVQPFLLDAGDEAALYDLIRRRFIASQMAPARYTVTGAIIRAGKTPEQPYPLLFRAQSRTLAFDGFLRVYEELAEDDEAPDTPLPNLEQGQTLTLLETLPEEHATRPPHRYTAAKLIHALEQRGIGRPSTYASMVKIIQDRGYVQRAGKHLTPTDSGYTLCDYVTGAFPQVFDYGYTADLEAQLDRVAAGETSQLAVLRAFWAVFQPQLHEAGTQVAQGSRPVVLHPAAEG
jgi:DNA topoisomerase-1